MHFGHRNEDLESYIKQIKEYPLLTKEEELEIFEKKSLNDNDKEKLIVSNLKFVVQEAFKFKHEQIDVMDLIQAGNLGLIDAVRKYDPQKSISFIGFAKFDIRNRMIRALQNFSVGKNIRIPDQTRLKISKIKKAKEAFYNSNGRDATLKEISEITDIDEKKIKKLCSHINNHTKSMDVIVDSGYLEPTSDNNDILENRKEIILLEIEKHGLTELEKSIIVSRFIEGIDFCEIVEKNKCSKEWIRKNQKNAIRKLRNSDNLKDLFMEWVKIN
jgi:RNA polymerase primary sigma factor